MVEIRLSRKCDIPYLKEIWKICFGDEDTYIDFFFYNKYKEDKTFVLLSEGEIVAMLTMIDVNIKVPNKQDYNSVMLYAIATHPKCQGMGFSTLIMSHTKEYLLKHNIDILTLVPAEENLIKFYSKRGYIPGFYIKESKITYDDVQKFKHNEINKFKIEPAKPEEYNTIRNEILENRIYVEYSNDEVSYQKKLCERTRANIYTLNYEGIKGCLTVERINGETIIIKELLIQDNLIEEALINISKLFPAKEYILRLPSYSGKDFNGLIKSFGMIMPLKEAEDVFNNTFAYLGFAYD